MKKIILQKPPNDPYKDRTCPEWFRDAKLGIFIHWGPYSVPAWAPTGEGIISLLAEAIINGGYDVDSVNCVKKISSLIFKNYIKRLEFKKLFKAIRLFNVNTYSEWYWNSIHKYKTQKKYHTQNWGDKNYTEFGRDFDQAVTDWNPDNWSDLFKAIGAKYVTITSKHHDGYCLWPTAYENPKVKNWNSSRDLLGDLNKSLIDREIHLSLYYSAGLDWSLSGVPIKLKNIETNFIHNKDELEYIDNQVKELIDRYKPSVLWEDIGYSENGDFESILKYYYDRVPEGVVNDRAQPAMDIPAKRHFDFTTTEYFVPQSIREVPWETCRGITGSFAYNRDDDKSSCLTAAELVASFADIISKNGNLVLGIGPKADGTIPDFQVNVIREFGEWINENSEGIYGTRPFTRFDDKTTSGNDVRYTTKDEKLNAIIIGQANGSITFENIKIKPDADVKILGKSGVAGNGKGGVLLKEPVDSKGCILQFNLRDIA